MLVERIDPHLRSAGMVSINPSDHYFRSPDHRIYYILSDGCSVEVDGRLYPTPSDSVLLILPGNRYKFHPQGEFCAYALNFDYDRSDRHITAAFGQVREDVFDPSMLTGVTEFADREELNSVIYLENCSDLRRLFERIAEEFSLKKQLYTDICSLVLKDIVITVLRRLSSSSSENRVDKLLDYINANCARNISNTELANLMGYHPYHLNRIMRRATGTTLHQYLINCRISLAVRYLTETALPVGEVCRLSGYGNLSNFSVDFKRKTGYAPGEYRRRSRMVD